MNGVKPRPGVVRRQQDDAVLLLIACGYTDAQIAEELGVSFNQISESNTRLRIRFNQPKNRAHMIALAYHKGDLQVP